METFVKYLLVFAIGGAFCLIAQVLIIRTKLTSARILVIFLIAGILLESLGVFQYIGEVGKAGASIPIIGFGSSLAKGAIEGFKEKGILGLLTGGLTKTSAGIAAAVFFSYIAALVVSPKTKK
ncbi:MAG: SpoVA/SpoVAEb family sporulation membrane protein [Clostridiales bacterium]|jgi:stage V sporulation protein AE|nr:SpoVA/SpoVAEb family sporulation membrane protein [Clostridiales bacterium]